jgi:hypothetical protein
MLADIQPQRIHSTDRDLQSRSFYFLSLLPPPTLPGGFTCG